jgi:hypothetical protein
LTAEPQCLLLSEDSIHITFRLYETDFPVSRPMRLYDHDYRVAHLAFCVPPSLTSGGTGILNLFPIDYAFQPRLRGRLTPGGRSLPGKPWDFGDQDSHLVFVTYVRIIACVQSTVACASASTQYTTLLYQVCLTTHFRGFGSMLESRSFSAQTLSTSQLLRTV